MRRTTLVCALSAFGLSLLFGANAIAGDDKGKGKGHDSLRIHLKGFEEVPVVVTAAVGNLELDINEAAPSIAYELSYSGLEGTVTQSHIHIAQKNVNGGIVLWLCQTATNPAPAQAAATPTYPGPNGGTYLDATSPQSRLGPLPSMDARAVALRIRSGQVHINNPPWSPDAPFGGYKRSGNGREYGIEGLEEYLETKAILGFTDGPAPAAA